MMSSEQGGGGGFDVVTGYTQIDSDRFASRIIGAGVYDSGAGDANHLGDISDLVVNETGDIVAVIIGVGGFLGIGEKQVAVSYDALQWVVAEDETERFVVETTVDELNAAPDFVVVEDDPAEGSSAEAVTSEPVESAPAEGDAMAPAPAEGDAMATSSVAQ
jgi:sporulation protein YlmC with PRC-barrel domain